MEQDEYEQNGDDPLEGDLNDVAQDNLSSTPRSDLSGTPRSDPSGTPRSDLGGNGDAEERLVPSPLSSIIPSPHSLSRRPAAIHSNGYTWFRLDPMHHIECVLKMEV